MDKISKVKNLLSELTSEHLKILEKAKYIEKELNEPISEDIIEEILKFLTKDVYEHAQKEEIDLEQAVLDANITTFDIEALKFGHTTLEEIEEHLKYLISLYKKGERKYLNKDLEDEIKKEFIQYVQTLKDHFIEEENFFFPDILNYDIEI